MPPDFIFGMDRAILSPFPFKQRVVRPGRAAYSPAEEQTVGP